MSAWCPSCSHSSPMAFTKTMAPLKSSPWKVRFNFVAFSSKLHPGTLLSRSSAFTVDRGGMPPWQGVHRSSDKLHWLISMRDSLFHQLSFFWDKKKWPSSAVACDREKTRFIWGLRMQHDRLRHMDLHAMCSCEKNGNRGRSAAIRFAFKEVLTLP